MELCLQWDGWLGMLLVIGPSPVVNTIHVICIPRVEAELHSVGQSKSFLPPPSLLPPSHPFAFPLHRGANQYFQTVVDDRTDYEMIVVGDYITCGLYGGGQYKW